MFKVKGLGFEVQGLGFRLWGWVWGSGVGCSGFGV